MILIYTVKKGHCSDCFRSTRACLIHNRFLAWYRCSRCWTPTEKAEVNRKRYISVLHSTEVSHARRVTTVTRFTSIRGALLPIGSEKAWKGVATAFMRGYVRTSQEGRQKDRTGEADGPMTAKFTEPETAAMIT